MKTRLISTFLALMLCACSSNEGTDNKESSKQIENKEQQITAKSSKLHQYMSKEQICDALSINDIQQLFQTTAEIKSAAFDFRSRYTCSYTWDKTDKTEREQLMFSNSMQVAQGKAEKRPMRLKTPTNQITVTLLNSKKTPANFIPPKLNNKQLEEQIKNVKDTAAKKLSKQQQELGGNMANNMVENLMIQGNQNQAIDDVGDAAYWTSVGSGGLNILVGDVEIYVGPMIADTESEDIENAKKIATVLLN